MRDFIKKAFSIFLCACVFLSVQAFSEFKSEAETAAFKTVFNFSTAPISYGHHNINASAVSVSDPGYYDSSDIGDTSNKALKLTVNNTLNTGGAYNNYAQYFFYPGNPNAATQPVVPFAGDGIRIWIAFTSPVYTTHNLFKISVMTGFTGAGTGIIGSSTYTSIDYTVKSSGGYVYIPYSKLKNSASISILDAVQGTSTAEQRIAGITGIMVQFAGTSNADLANYTYIYVDSLEYYTDTTKTPQPEVTNAPRSSKGFVNLTGTTKYSDVKIGTGRTFYVSQKRGSDSNPGTKELPFKTISRARQDNAAGDTVVLEEGIYNEKVVYYTNSGTKDQPITLMGEKDNNVTITSYDPISSNWELFRDGIYKTNIGANRDITHALWQHGGGFNNLVEARWPNADAEDVLSMQRAYMESGTGAQGITDSHLPAGDWNGATVFAWTGKTYEQYVAFTRTITNYAAGTSLSFDHEIPGDGSGSTYTPGAGDWYYITGALAGLDTSREYFYDKTTGDFYVMMPDGIQPSDSEIWVETRGSSIEDWSSDYLQFANLNIVGGGVGIDAGNCFLDNVNVYYADFFSKSDGYETLHDEYNGNHLHGANNVWKNSEVAYTMSTGIFVLGNYNTIENCVIHDVAYNGGYNSAVTINPEVKYTTIRRCTLYNSGRYLIHFAYGDVNTGNQGTIIEYNDIYGVDRLTQDGGAIYTYHRDGGGSTIRYNWVHDCMSPGTCGIYLDNESKNFNVYRNVVWGVREASIALNTNSLNNKIFNNTVLSYSDNVQGWPKNPTSSMSGTEFRNNIFTGSVDYVKGSYSPTFGVNSFDALPPIDSFFIPTQSSSLVDKGEIIAGYQDYDGSAPDLGAYEYGGHYWVPGAVDAYPTLESKLGITVNNGFIRLSPSQNYNFGDGIETDKIATGGTIKLYYYGQLFDSAAIILNGDVSCDGRADSADLLLIKRSILKITVLSKNQKLAADLDGDGSITSPDLLIIKKYILRLQNI